jgi:hypothetical protein
MAAPSVGGAGHDDVDSAGSAEGAMVAQNPSSGNNNDENSPERVSTRRRACSNLTVPARRSKWLFVMRKSGIVPRIRESGNDHREHEI